MPVKNRDRAIAFYSALTGVDLERQPNALMFDESDTSIATLVHLNVAHPLDDALAFVWSNGGRVIEPTPVTAGQDRFALVMDCEGNHVALYSSGS